MGSGGAAVSAVAVTCSRVYRAPGSNASSSSRSCLFRARVANLHDGLGQGVDLGLNVFVRSFRARRLAS